MALRKTGTVVYWQNLSDILAIFRLMPEEGSKFPDYKAGQYIALRRENCKLTKKIGTDENGKPIFGPDLDENGVQKIGQVTHSYSISSAPFETAENGYLEFYVILERDEHSEGRLTGSLFRIEPAVDDKIVYVDRITGDFTLDKRAAAFENVLLVGTGTGLAPFAGMVKQLYREAKNGNSAKTRYTLLHTNRIYQELGYHEQLLEIEKSNVFDFLYIPSVSRPTQRDVDDPGLGIGRANNTLRYIFGMPLKEEEILNQLTSERKDISRAEAALKKTVRPVLPRHLTREKILERLEPAKTVILTCGNPDSMADIKYIADTNHIHFEKEDW